MSRFTFSKTVKIFQALLTKSAVLQLEIDAEQKKARPDWRRLLTLKKQRLLVKDRLERLRREVRRRRSQRQPVLS